MWKVEYKSLLSGAWVQSHLGHFASRLKAENAAKRELIGYETRATTA